VLYSLLTPSLAASTTITTSLQPTKAPRGQIHLPTPSPTPKTSHGSQIAAAKSFIQLIAHHHHPVRFTYLHPAQLQIPPAAPKLLIKLIVVCCFAVAMSQKTRFSHTGILCTCKHLEASPHFGELASARLRPLERLFWTSGAVSRVRRGLLIMACCQAWGGCRLGGVNIQGPPFGQSTCTNHRNRGRTSADRSTRATLVLTVPRSLIKSSTKDLT
jgi:hypothetical protein